MPKTLYHFTSDSFLPSIKRDGIWRGDVPTSSEGGFNAPWLTSDGSWPDQGWAADSPIDKSQVRLTLQVPDEDPKLVLWSTLAREEGVDPVWYNALDQAGGGGSAAWSVYRGRIPWSWVTQTELRPDPEPKLRQDLPAGWGMGKTGLSRGHAPKLVGRLNHVTQGNGEKHPRFNVGEVDITDKAYRLLSHLLDAEVESGEIDAVTMMLARHVGNEPGKDGLATIQEAEGVVYRLLTIFKPHQTLIMLADEA